MYLRLYIDQSVEVYEVIKWELAPVSSISGTTVRMVNGYLLKSMWIITDCLWY